MRDELTEVDIRKMREEIDYRENVLMPQIIAEVQRTRAFGDLSENAEYKAAKDEQRRNRSRIRYLKNMVESAVIIEDRSSEKEVGLFDKVKLFMEDDDEEMVITIVTTLRQNPLNNLISKESPLGKAVLGHKAGERVYVQVNESIGYWVKILELTKGEDDETLEISRY